MIENLRAWHKQEEKFCKISNINDKGAFLIGVKAEINEWDKGIFIENPTDGRFCFFDEFELLRVVTEL